MFRCLQTAVVRGGNRVFREDETRSRWHDTGCRRPNRLRRPFQSLARTDVAVAQEIPSRSPIPMRSRSIRNGYMLR